MNEPLSELDREVIEADNPERRPQLYRLLRESELFALVPYHPELAGKSNNPVRLVVWQSSLDGKQIPVFTSMARCEEAFKKMKIGPRKYTAIKAKGFELFRTISFQKHGFVINPGCATGMLCMDAKAAAKLADGSALKPMDTQNPQTLQMLPVPPAEHPTELLRPLLNHLRRCPDVRAVWLFYRLQPPDDPKPRSYVFGFFARGDVEAIKQEFMVVAGAAAGDAHGVSATTLEPQNPAHAQVFAKIPPIYIAADYYGPDGKPK